MDRVYPLIAASTRQRPLATASPCAVQTILLPFPLLLSTFHSIRHGRMRDATSFRHNEPVRSNAARLLGDAVVDPPGGLRNVPDMIRCISYPLPHYKAAHYRGYWRRIGM
jgi:hypothetical protein